MAGWAALSPVSSRCVYAGVAEVSVNGAEQPAVRVRVNPVALASMGLNMEDVRTAIANSNAMAAKSASSTVRNRGVAAALPSVSSSVVRREGTSGFRARTACSVACAA